MGNFSRDPLTTLVDNLARGYVGLRVEQGVPVLDRDLNLLSELVAATVRKVVARYIGDGVPEGGDGFRIQAVADPNDFLIRGPIVVGSGFCLVGGLEVEIDGDVRYSGQVPVPPALQTPAGIVGTRTDLVYLDVWLEEVEADAVLDLDNSVDVGTRTSVRIKPAWAVRVAEQSDVLPAPADGHAHTPLARLTREVGNARVEEAMIEDLRQTRLSLAAVERRLRVLEAYSIRPAFAPEDPVAPSMQFIGQLVTLTGSNFVEIDGVVPRVYFDGVESPAIELLGPDGSYEKIRAEVPVVPAGMVEVRVATAGGVTEPAAQLDVMEPLGPPPVPDIPPPTLAAEDPVVPSMQFVGATITVTGTNLGVAGVSVTFTSEDVVGAEPVLSPNITIINLGEITVEIPDVAAGSYTITIRNTPEGDPATSAGFEVRVP